jgi:hypothetical protein
MRSPLSKIIFIFFKIKVLKIYEIMPKSVGKENKY